jgi:UDPglucose 6-dehydrogenase
MKASLLYMRRYSGLFAKVFRRKLISTNDYEFAIKVTYVSFVCVGTPSAKNRFTDLSIGHSAVKSIGTVLKTKEGHHILVVKSTVVPETTDKFVLATLEEVSGKTVGRDIEVAVNPEFLREGTESMIS